MEVKKGMEQAHANFTAGQLTSENGRALLGFMEAWSGMMEYAVDLGADNITQLAELTVRPAAAAAGITNDKSIEAGAAHMVKCWIHGDKLAEWSIFHPPEILTEDHRQDMWAMSPATLNSLPELVEAYPGIQDSCPDILEQQKMVMDAPAVSSFPQMCM